MKRPGLPAMQAFRRVVELQSFNAAARSLQMSGGAVSKLVAQLEQDLGVRLLQRTTRSVRVNGEGAAFYQFAARILDDVDAAAEAVRKDVAAPAGPLRVAVPTSFALRVLAARLPHFVARHPGIVLDLVLNDRYVDIVQEGFDCAVRIASHLADSTLSARRLGTLRRVVVASPAYLQMAPPLDEPEDLQAHACLVYSQDGGPVAWPLGRAAQALPIVGAVRVNNSVMLRDLLVAGLGVTLTPEFVVADLLRDGSVVPVLHERPVPDLIVHGVTAHPRFVPNKVAVFFGFVRDAVMAASAGAARKRTARAS